MIGGAKVSLVMAKPVRSVRKPRGEGHERRAEILVAAQRIFVECGYEGATIRRIADEVGLSSTALYMHFRDKSEMLLEICREAFQTLLERNRIARQSPGEPEIKVRRMLKDYMTFGLKNPNAYRLIFLTRPQEASQGAQHIAQDLGRKVYEGFELTVAELAASGRLTCSPEIAAQVLWAGAHGVVALIITKPYFAWAPPEQLGETMLDALFDGLVRA